MIGPKAERRHEEDCGWERGGPRKGAVAGLIFYSRFRICSASERLESGPAVHRQTASAGMKAAPLLPARVGKLQSRIMAAFAASVQLDTLTDTEPALREGTQLCCIGRTHLRRRMQQTRCRARKLPSWAASSLKSL